MKRSVKFIKDFCLKIEGETRQFRKDDIFEIEEEVALKLFKEGFVLPGPQTTEPIRGIGE